MLAFLQTPPKWQNYTHYFHYHKKASLDYRLNPFNSCRRTKEKSLQYDGSEELQNYFQP